MLLSKITMQFFYEPCFYNLKTAATNYLDMPSACTGQWYHWASSLLYFSSSISLLKELHVRHKILSDCCTVFSQGFDLEVATLEVRVTNTKYMY